MGEDELTQWYEADSTNQPQHANPEDNVDTATIGSGAAPPVYSVFDEDDPSAQPILGPEIPGMEATGTGSE